MEFVYCLLGAEGILGVCFFVFDALQQFFAVDDLGFVEGYRCDDSIVCNRTYYYIVVVLPAVLTAAVAEDEVEPLLGASVKR